MAVGACARISLPLLPQSYESKHPKNSGMGRTHRKRRPRADASFQRLHEIFAAALFRGGVHEIRLSNESGRHYRDRRTSLHGALSNPAHIGPRGDFAHGISWWSGCDACSYRRSGIRRGLILWHSCLGGPVSSRSENSDTRSAVGAIKRLIAIERSVKLTVCESLYCSSVSVSRRWARIAGARVRAEETEIPTRPLLPRSTLTLDRTTFGSSASTTEHVRSISLRDNVRFGPTCGDHRRRYVQLTVLEFDADLLGGGAKP